MDEQPFAYYQHTQQFDSYSATQYPPGPYDPHYVANDGSPFVDQRYGGAQVQGGAQGWSTAFPTPNATASSFQRRGGVSGAAPENSRPEVDGEVRSGQLRLDVNVGDNGSEPRHENTANLGSPLDLRPHHPDSAVTSTTYPTGSDPYNPASTSPSYDMNRDHGRSNLPLSLTMPHDSTYFMGMYSNQLPPPQSAPPTYSDQHRQPMAHHHHQQYLSSRSPQSQMPPLSAPMYGSSTPRIGLSIPYTPSSIASGSARSVSPASTAATSAQPLDFSTLASPSGEVGSAPMHSPIVRSLGAPTTGLPHALSPPARITGPTRPSAGGHAVSPIRRRAGKQRLDDARRKEICTYARDRPKARQEDIALRYGVERSTISKILKNKDKWLTMDTHTRKPIPVKHSSPVFVRPSKFPEIETELLKWVKECKENGTAITDTLIKAKARECAADIGLPEGKFKASSGWIENFKVRNSLTKRSQDDRDVSPVNDEHDEADQMDEDEDVPIPASQSTQIDDGYDADENGQDSFNSFVSLSTQAESGLMPPDTSFSTFSTTDSVASSSQDLGLFNSNTPMSSNASSFASSPSGALPHCVLTDAGMRSRGHSHSIAMRAVGPSGSPQSGASPVQPLSPARLDMRFTSTPTSASIPRFPSPLSASTSASGNPPVMVRNARRTPVAHSRHPSDASGFSYEHPSHSSVDVNGAFSQHSYQSPTSHEALDALDTILRFLQQPQAAEIASPPECTTFRAVRARLVDRMVRAHQQHQPGAMNNAGDTQ